MEPNTLFNLASAGALGGTTVGALVGAPLVGEIAGVTLGLAVAFGKTLMPKPIARSPAREPRLALLRVKPMTGFVRSARP